MKILYRRELQRTTPTNFLYHVRLTYWLPLQLLWAELYLKEKGTQIGSPPEEKEEQKEVNCGIKMYNLHRSKNVDAQATTAPVLWIFKYAVF